MTRLALPLLALALALALAGCPRARPSAPPQSPPRDARAAAGATTFVDWYPADISLPPGVQYPCEVTALPRDLDGIPEADRGYVNHACAVLIGLLRDKQVLLAAMAKRQDASAALAAYLASAEGGTARLAAEAVPGGLEGFHAAVLEAIALQGDFFEAAVPRRAGGASMQEVHSIEAGHAASRKLIEAWAVIQAKYPGWSPAVKDSVYHHLCGLDLF